MKNPILFFAILTLFYHPLSLAGQTEQGAILLGGSGQVQVSEDITTIVLAPQLAYFFADQFAFGGIVDFTFLSYGEGAAATMVGLQPFARYYLLGNETTKLFAQLSFQYLIVEGENPVGYGGGLGLDIFLNRHVAFEMMAGYDRLTFPKYNYGYGSFGVKLGFGIFLN